MPLTDFQRRLLAALAEPPNEERYLAGGAAMHFAPNSVRYSDDLDFFHDSEARVASAFAQDRRTLETRGYRVETELALPGFVRALVSRDDEATRIDWAHDSAWRFMPLVRDPLGGLLLHPIDLAINKVLALAGRDEPRDFVDILFGGPFRHACRGTGRSRTQDWRSSSSRCQRANLSAHQGPSRFLNNRNASSGK